MRPLEGIKILDCPHVPAPRVRELREALADPQPRSLRPGPGLR
jgi:hypothetical protein